MKMTVYFIRHAETPGNLERRYIGGRTDEPLSDAGRKNAAQVKGLPTLCRVYSSPMKRVVETAEIMFPQAEIIPVEGLREMDFGVFEGRNADEMENDPAYRAWVEGFCKDAPPGGEDMEGFTGRTCRAFVSCLERERERGEKTAAVVAHGGHDHGGHEQALYACPQLLRLAASQLPGVRSRDRGRKNPYACG